MLIFNKRIPCGRGLAAVLLKRAASVELDWDVRQKSRFDATDSGGRNVGVALPRGSVVRGGDVLVGEDGSLLRVLAAPQPVLVVQHCSAHGSPFDLLRAAYHLGNRHVPLQLTPERLLLEPDHVLADMLRRQHLIVSEASEAFEPESGAYGTDDGHAAHAHGPAHAHDHGNKHGPAHGHGAAPGPAPALAQSEEHGHVHGPDCGHDHDHDHHDHDHHGHGHGHQH